MRKTKLIADENTLIVVSHPDWSTEELETRVRQAVKGITLLQIFEDPTNEFPDLEFGENGERLFSWVDFING